MSHQHHSQAKTYRRLFHVAGHCLLGGVVMMASSCGASRQFGGVASKKSTPTAPMAKTEEVQHAYADQQNSESNLVTQLEHNAPENNVPPESIDDLSLLSSDPFLNLAASELQPASVQTESGGLDSALTLVSAEQPRPMPEPLPAETPPPLTEEMIAPGHPLATQEALPLATVSAPQCPLCQTDNCQHSVFNALAGGAYTPPVVPEIVGDEYLRDGGDRDTKVYYTDDGRNGLNTEDTVAEWIDEDGNRQVRPSSTVSVYAPRFGAVRSATAPQIGLDVDGLAGNHDGVAAVGLDTRLKLDETTHNDEALAMLMASRVSGLENQLTEDSMHQNVSASKHSKLIGAHQEIAFLMEGRFDNINAAAIGDAIAAAQQWTGDLGVVIYAHNQAGQEVQAKVFAQEYTGVEDQSRAGDLAIVKAVDKTSAQPGDELTFTIRFDNIGDRPLSQVRVVDNLTPRLIYLDGSVDSNLDGTVNTEDNGAGSQILTFTFVNPLAGHTGGWVSFKCRVR